MKRNNRREFGSYVLVEYTREDKVGHLISFFDNLTEANEALRVAIDEAKDNDDDWLYRVVLYTTYEKQFDKATRAILSRI